MSTATLFGYDDLPGLLALMAGDEKHDPAALSTLDPLWVLYDRVLDVSPETMHSEKRDRLLLSKGHGPQAYYAVLAARGFFPVEVLSSYGRYDSPLGYHPDRLLVAGVEISSGSLGHGLSIAAGMAVGLRASGNHESRVFCVVGDAELDEGSNHEAIAFAGRVSLARLSAVVIDNDSSSYGWPGGVERRFETEGWEARRVPATDHDALAGALSGQHPGRPLVVVATSAPAANTWHSLGSGSNGGHDAGQS